MKKLMLLLSIYILNLFTSLAVEPLLLTTKNPLLAKINGEKIYLGDIDNLQIHKAHKELFKLIQDQLKIQIINKLQQQDSKIKIDVIDNISLQQINQFCKTHGISLNQCNSSHDQIKNYILVQKREELIDYEYEKAKKKGAFINYLNDPGAFVIQVPVKDMIKWNQKNQKYMLIEFFDYQCPYCLKIQSTMLALKKKFDKNIIFAFAHFPLSFHKRADEAAIASECANEQKAFEKYNNLLFETRQKDQDFSEQKLYEYARRANIKSIKKFQACLKNEKFREKINNHIKLAQQIGISGVPALVFGKYNRQKQILVGEVLTREEPVIKLISRKIKEYSNKK